MIRDDTRALLATLRRDAERYVWYSGNTPSTRAFLRAFLADQGLQATVVYRVKRFLRRRPRTVVTVGALMAMAVVSRLNDICTGIFISPGAEIGPGLFLAHYGGVIIGAGARIGENCNIGNQVSIGSGSPRIGDRCVVSVGARVMGNVQVGSDAHIGANAVVTRDVADREVVVGNPARAVSRRGSFAFLEYPGCDTDPARVASRALVDAEGASAPGR